MKATKKQDQQEQLQFSFITEVDDETMKRNLLRRRIRAREWWKTMGWSGPKAGELLQCNTSVARIHGSDELQYLYGAICTAECEIEPDVWLVVPWYPPGTEETWVHRDRAGKKFILDVAEIDPPPQKT